MWAPTCHLNKTHVYDTHECKLRCKLYHISWLQLLFIVKATQYQLLQKKICDWICEKGLIYASNFSTLMLYNSACVWPTALKFSSRTVLLLHLYDRKFQLNSLLINYVVPLQSCTIGCVYKTPFRKSSHISWLIIKTS